LGGAFWRFRQSGSFRVAHNLEGGKRKTRAPVALITRDLDEIYALTPREFEEFVRNILTRLGYRNLSVVGGAGDLGVDIFGHDAFGRSVAVQCKRYAPGKRIGSPTIMTFLTMQKFHHEAEVGIFVTTADFTRDARNLAAHHDIWLINGVELVGLVHGG
jgi:restriction system protein